MVGTGILPNNMRSPSPECYTTFWMMTTYSDTLHWLGHYTNFWPLLIWTLLPNLTFYLQNNQFIYLRHTSHQFVYKTYKQYIHVNKHKTHKWHWINIYKYCNGRRMTKRRKGKEIWRSASKKCYTIWLRKCRLLSIWQTYIDGMFGFCDIAWLIEKGKRSDAVRVRNTTQFQKNSYVSSILNYGCEVWGSHKAHDVEKVHLDFCKNILGVTRRTNNVMVYIETGRLPLRFVRLIRML